ncbi:MAG TPA: hypothetical protein VIE47_01840 [Methylocystis sp.]|jgi:hypothetical protein
MAFGERRRRPNFAEGQRYPLAADIVENLILRSSEKFSKPLMGQLEKEPAAHPASRQSNERCPPLHCARVVRLLSKTMRPAFIFDALEFRSFSTITDCKIIDLAPI